MGKTLDLDAYRRLLETQRDQLLASNEDREAAGETVELDQQRVGRLSRMDAMQMQAMAKAERQRADALLRQIGAALARIDSGDYGYCLDCDEPIAAARLQVNPSASLCIDCAERKG